jgi:hypothetical protein
MTTTAGTALKVSELARLTADFLAGAGVRVTGPDPGDGGRLAIGHPDARYWLLVTDDAHAELQSDDDDPRHVADVAAALLSAIPSDARHPDAISGGGITFKGIAGMDLKAKGFDVALNVYTDDFYYDVSGDIAVTNPRADAGTVYINDQGGLTWFRDLWPGHAGTEWEPQFRTWLPDPPAVAREIAATVARAIGAGHGPQS